LSRIDRPRVGVCADARVLTAKLPPAGNCDQLRFLAVSIFEELRALDDVDEARTLRFSSSDLLLWPFVRWTALSAALDQIHGLQAPFATRRRTVVQQAELVARSAFRGPLSVRRPFDIVIVASSGGLVLQREGKWFDRINDYFAMELPDRTLVLDSGIHGGYKTPRFPPHVRCFDTFDIRAGLSARLRRPDGSDLAAIERLLGFIREHFPVAPSSAELERIRAQLIHWAVRLPRLHGWYARFFDRVRPRVILVEDASHGAFAHVCTWARAAGIATAEPQHGVISRSHLAYNYGDAARADDTFASCLPRHLLLYGEFWRDQVRSPSEIVIAGCPHFSETARPAARSSPGTVLTISQGICTEVMVRLTTAVARRFPDRRCVFRVHPGEVAFPERYRSLTEIANVEISERGDIYQQLRDAGVVIGHSSMALVEAAGVGLPVLVFDDETSRAHLPRDVGTRFHTVDELLLLVESPPPITSDPERFFAAGWRERYRSFIARV
jgi:hypothetical protein